MIRLVLFTVSTIIYFPAQGQKSYFLYNDAGESYSDNNFKEAIEMYTKAIELNDFPSIEDMQPQDYLVKSYFYRGLAKDKVGDVVGMIADLTKSIQLNEVSSAHVNIILDTKAELHKERGFAKYRLGDFRGAISDFDAALKIRNYNPTLLYYKGLSLEGRKDYHGALKAYQSAEFNYREKPSRIYYCLGMIKLKLGQIQDGCNDLSTAGELGEADAYKAIQKYCN